MADGDKSKTVSDADVLATASSPIVFISHDSRDAELADAFSKLLKSVSAGMIKTFRSSDRKGTDGIAFGEEWYNRLMLTLQSTSDVVCLFTERSVDRPWILFEAGVAKGKLNTVVVGVALGISLNRVAAGPFYQFQNMDDSEADLIKLINQLATRVPALELDGDVVKAQVAAFKAAEEEILKKLGSPTNKKAEKESADENSIAKLVEEMKALPSRVAERMADSEEGAIRRRRSRRFHPMMFEEIGRMLGDPEEPLGVLMAASVVRDDAPWLYELLMEVYRAIKTGDATVIANEMKRVERFSKFLRHGPMLEEFGLGDKQTYMLIRELPFMLHRLLDRFVPTPKAVPRRRPNKPTKLIAEE